MNHATGQLGYHLATTGYKLETGLNYCNFTLVGASGPAPWRWPFPDQ